MVALALNSLVQSLFCLHFLESTGFISVCICFFFVSGFIVGLTNVSPAITAPTLWNYDLCIQYPAVVPAAANAYAECTSEMPPRRYLIVQIERANDQLIFCEIEVYPRSMLIFFLLTYS